MAVDISKDVEIKTPTLLNMTIDSINFTGSGYTTFIYSLAVFMLSGIVKYDKLIEVLNSNTFILDLQTL